MTASPQVMAAGEDLVELGHVHILHLDSDGASAIAHVQSLNLAHTYLATVIDPRHYARPMAGPLSSCTCQAGHHDTYCQHVHALVLTIRKATQ